MRPRLLAAALAALALAGCGAGTAGNSPVARQTSASSAPSASGSPTPADGVPIQVTGVRLAGSQDRLVVPLPLGCDEQYAARATEDTLRVVLDVRRGVASPERCYGDVFEAWLDVPLRGNIGDRTVEDAAGGDVVVVPTEGLLTATSLPAGFRLETRTEAYAGDAADRYAWRFRWHHDDFALALTAGSPTSLDRCDDPRPVTVRGTSGTGCGTDRSEGGVSVSWLEGGRRPMTLAVALSEAAGKVVPYALSDLVAVANALRPAV